MKRRTPPRPTASLVIALCVSAFSAGPLAFGSWTITASMAVPRTQHAAARLADGRVLVAGGITTGATTGTAETYDPASGTWSATGSMLTPRSRHTATLLAGNRV